jgi:hypothetical protein
MNRSIAFLVAMMVLAAMGPHLAEGVVRSAAGLPSVAFAPPGTAQQIAVLWEAIRRRGANA